MGRGRTGGSLATAGRSHSSFTRISRCSSASSSSSASTRRTRATRTASERWGRSAHPRACSYIDGDSTETAHAVIKQIRRLVVLYCVLFYRTLAAQEVEEVVSLHRRGLVTDE